MMNIFILCGQSNMKGYAPVPVSQKINNNIQIWRDSEWIIASEPIHQPYAGPGMGFALALSDLYGNHPEIGLVPCAVGGTTIEQWQKGQPVYQEALNRTLVALSAKPDSQIAAILFAQGESNTGSQSAADGWGAKAIQFVIDFRLDIGDTLPPTIPAIFAQLGPDPQLPEYAYWTYLQNLQKQIINPANYPLLRLISTKDLPANGTHFADAEAYSVVGRRFAASYFINFP